MNTAKLLKLAGVYFAPLGRIGSVLETIFGKADPLFKRVEKLQDQRCQKVGQGLLGVSTLLATHTHSCLFLCPVGVLTATWFCDRQHV